MTNRHRGCLNLMMNFRNIFGLVCFTQLILTFSLPAVAEEFTNALHAYLQQCVHADIPNGCMVAGVVDEHGSWIVSSGTLDNGTDQEANGDTLFCVRSMTGTFTRLLLQDMVERGEMRLDDPAAKYLLDLVRMPTRNGKEITLRHLIDETSGIPDFWNTLNPKYADNPMADFTVEKMNAFVSGCQLTGDPGTEHFHGGVDTGLLGEAIGLRAGTDFELLMVERFLRPLQMDNTRFTLTREMKLRLASEHNELGYPMPQLDWGALKPLAGLYSTANDLLKFIGALQLKPSSPFRGYWLAGFPSGAQRGAVVYTGGGVGGVGARSLACFDRAQRRGAVILSTSADLGRNIDDYLLDCEWASDRRPAATNIATQLYDTYVGLYRPTSRGFEFWPSIGIRCQGSRLFAQTIGGLDTPDVLLLPPIAGELLTQSQNRFFERLSGKPVEFSQNARGKITGLTMHCQGKALSFDKVSDQAPKAPEPRKLQVFIKLDTALLDACAGQYEFPPKAPFSAGAKATIWREGDHLLCRVSGQNAIQGAFNIYPTSQTNFFVKMNGTRLIFVKNDAGLIMSVIHRSSQPGVPDAEAKKLSGWAR